MSGPSIQTSVDALPTPASVVSAIHWPWSRLTLALAALAAVGLLGGCSWFRPSEQDRRRAATEYHTLKPTPGTKQNQAQGGAAAKPKTAASDQARPGNPAAWGEGAQVAVGRQFEPIYFDADSAELNYAARQRLNSYIQWFQEHPRVWITLAGYADERDSTPFGYNLGMARALAVQEYLIGHGLDKQRGFPISFGEDLPAAEAKGEAAQALNNRVELLAFNAPVGQEEPAPIAPDKAPAPQAETPPQAPPAPDIP